MSAWKGFLRVMVGLAALGVLGAFALIALVTGAYISAPDAQPYVMAGFALVFPLWAITVLLMVEFAEPRRKGKSWWAQGLSFGELRTLVRWCPRPLLYASLLVATGAMVVSAKIGSTHWSFGEDFTARHAIGFSLGIAIFCSFALPVLASASRMPGAFSDHYKAST